jgi:hypothetical protein
MGGISILVNREQASQGGAILSSTSYRGDGLKRESLNWSWRDDHLVEDPFYDYDLEDALDQQDVIVEHHEGSMHVAFIDDEGRDVHIITHDAEWETTHDGDIDKEMTWYTPKRGIDNSVMVQGRSGKEEERTYFVQLEPSYLDLIEMEDEWEPQRHPWRNSIRYRNSDIADTRSPKELLSITPTGHHHVHQKVIESVDCQDTDEESELLTIETSKVFGSILTNVDEMEDEVEEEEEDYEEEVGETNNNDDDDNGVILSPCEREFVYLEKHDGNLMEAPTRGGYFHSHERTDSMEEAEPIRSTTQRRTRPISDEARDTDITLNPARSLYYYEYGSHSDLEDDRSNGLKENRPRLKRPIHESAPDLKGLESQYLSETKSKCDYRSTTLDSVTEKRSFIHSNTSAPDLEWMRGSQQDDGGYDGFQRFARSEPSTPISMKKHRTSNLEETLVYRISHLLPPEKLTGVLRIIDPTRKIRDDQEILIDLGSLPQSKMLELYQYVEECLREMCDPQEKKPRGWHRRKHGRSNKPADPLLSRRTPRDHKDHRLRHIHSNKEDLIKKELLRPHQENDSEDEIDILGL